MFTIAITNTFNFYELWPLMGLRYFNFFALLLLCFQTLSVACTCMSVWPYFY